MKNFLFVSFLTFIFFSINSFPQEDLLDKLKRKVDEKIDKKTDEGIDNAIDEVEKKTEESINENKSQKKEQLKESKENQQPKKKSESGNQQTIENKKEADDTSLKQDENKKADFKSYQNYDFLPGEKIIFEDDFRDSQDGEFPPRWNLISGQGAANITAGEPAYVCIEGTVGSLSYIEPAIKTKYYLSEAFTIEFDFLLPEDAIIHVALKDNTDDYSRSISFSYDGLLLTNYFGNDLRANFPDENNIINKWHHLSIAYKNEQIKCFVDQHRLLVIPKCGFKPAAILLGMISNVRFKNIKIAEGGGMNMLGKILTDGRIVTHAIKFDVNKSTLKPESFGFLNELAKWLKENPKIILSIEGHTDSDGDEKSNQKLSEQRAESVKKSLIDLGIDGSRFKTKGFGESKPIDKNDTPAGKTNNRRVEFVKI